MTHRGSILLVSVGALLVPGRAVASDQEFLVDFTKEFCQSCHGGEAPASGFLADPVAADLKAPEMRDAWNRAITFVESEAMPPPWANKRPTEADRRRFVLEMRKALAVASEPDQLSESSGLVRRLNRIEYLNTIRDLTGARQFDLPLDFPSDNPELRFDTLGSGSHVTPSHILGFHRTAMEAADRLVRLDGAPSLPEPLWFARDARGKMPVRQDAWTRPGDSKGVYFTGANTSTVLGGLWAKGFVAPASGVYRARVVANAERASGADGKPLRLGFYAMDLNADPYPNRLPRTMMVKLGELEIPQSEPKTFTIDLPLDKGESFSVFCENRFEAGTFPDVLARPRSYGRSMKTFKESLLKKAVKSRKPTVRLESMEVSGPISMLPREQELLGDGPPTSRRAYVESAIIPFARRAYRRPLHEWEAESLVGSVLRHMAETGDPRTGIHYAIRRVLMAPQFLYRESGTESAYPLYRLASRLSYFLWSTMPDETLTELARDGSLSEHETLERQVNRMIAHPNAEEFIRSFAGQWLASRKAQTVMVCDTRYVFNDLVRHGIVRSTEMFFEEMLRKNHPIHLFLDSDFTYANDPMLKAWGMKGIRPFDRLAQDARLSAVKPEPKRIDLGALGETSPKHLATRGGVLGLTSILLSTGDGVESSPILRGVWVLANLYGTPPPPPPENVPDLAPDQSQAQTVREILAAHQSVESCAACHRAIDPIGLALENYDGAGGWRTAYYSAEKGMPVEKVDAQAVMPDGTTLLGPMDIKSHLLQQPQRFTRVLAGLLMEYALGRELTIEDRDAIEGIAALEPKNGGFNFRELIVKVVQSEPFMGDVLAEQ